MDNLTHSLTGALAGKILQKAAPADDRRSVERTLFWLVVIAANLPDIDVLFGITGDQIFSLKMHRGITHSMIAAPLLALVPAALFRQFSKVKELKLLWAAAYMGLVLHILIDLITPFGTQLLAPFSTMRFSLDWMFIIDPWFTFTIGILLFLARKFFPGVRRLLWITAGFVVAYLGMAAIGHGIAYQMMARSLFEEGMPSTTVAALPQPLNPFRWMGAARIDSGVAVSYFNLSEAERPAFSVVPDDRDQYTAAALATPEAQWYMDFARFPSVRSLADGEKRIVEIRDMQFAVEPALLARFGFGERMMPFTMRFTYSADGTLQTMTFNQQ